jgi:hypothetical protein
MTARTKAIGLAALIGFLATTAWSAGLVPAPCCAPSCEACPVAFCKGTAATASKVDAAHVPHRAPASFLPLPAAAWRVEALVQLSGFRSHGFRLPLRN